MQTKISIFLIFIIGSINKISGQEIPLPIPYEVAAFDSLMLRSESISPDSIIRLSLSFMHKYNLRKDKDAYHQFCKKMMANSQSKKVLHRITLLDLINTLKNSNLSKEKINNEFDQLYNTFMSEKDISAALELFFEWARHYERKKDKIESLKILFYGEKFAQANHLEEDINYQAILNLIGYTLWDMDKPVTSNSYFKKSFRSNYSPDFETMVAYNAMGINYQKMDSIDQSLIYFNKSREIAESTQNELFKTIVNGNAAHTLYKIKKYAQALEYAAEDKDASISKRLYENAVGAMNLMTKIELDQNHIAEVKQIMYQFSLVMPYIKPSDHYSLKRYKEAEYLYYEKINNFPKALSTYKEYKTYDGLFMENSNRSKISELQLDAEVKIYAQEMDQKEKERKTRNYLEIAMLVLLLSALFFVSRYFYKKTKVVEQEKSIISDINNKQAIEIKYLKKEIHELLSSIKSENDSQLENETGQQDLENLKKYNLARLEQWEEFKQLFSKLHPNFENDIKSKLDTVSTAELRLMMLHKLGLNTKDIAQILYISIDGVKKSKYRLYKKIGISTSEELDLFIEGKN